MPSDAAIYGQIQQFKPESQVNQLANVLQIQGAQQANQLNQLKMDEYQRGVQEQNSLRSLLGTQGFDISKPEWQQKLVSTSPTKGMEFVKQHLEGLRTKADAESKAFDLASKRYGAYRTTLGSLANDPALSKDKVLAAGQDDAIRGPQDLAGKRIATEYVRLTERYLARVLNRITLPGSLFLAAIALTPRERVAP